MIRIRVFQKRRSSTESDEKVRCSHILVKHRDSRRPSSWRQEKITRSKEDALELIKGGFLKVFFKILGTVSPQNSGQSSELGSRGKNKGKRYYLIVGKRFFAHSIKVSLIAFVLAIFAACWLPCPKFCPLTVRTISFCTNQSLSAHQKSARKKTSVIPPTP